MLKLQNVNVSIQAVHILRGVSLELPTGSMLGLIGRNGAGKTTLMKSIMGLLKASSGEIVFDNQDLRAIHTHQRTRLGIGYMPEDRRLIPDLTVEENVLVPAWAAKLPDARQRLEKVYGLIPEVREFGPRKGSQLSGGQQKLAALGRALMCGTRLLLLDEPFEGVAPALAQRLVEVVANLKKEGMSVILSESDLQHSERMVDRIIVIDRGSVKGRNWVDHDEAAVTGAESLIRTLIACGVDTCFTNPGTSEMHFVGALDRVEEMRCVLVLFEGVATGAADGYARMTGRPASTLLHLGPGLGNALANTHNARRAFTPMVNVVGEHATYHRQYDRRNVGI